MIKYFMISNVIDISHAHLHLIKPRIIANLNNSKKNTNLIAYQQFNTMYS